MNPRTIFLCSSRRKEALTYVFAFLSFCALHSPFCIGAPPPPVFPNPASGATNVPVDAQLYWSVGDQELILNGNFEAGSFSGWSKENQGFDTTLNNGTYQPFTGIGPQPPFAGDFCTITDQMAPGFATIYQDVTIPAGAQSAVLRWVDRLWNFAGAFFNPPGPQRFFVEVRSLSGAPLETLYVTETGDNPFSDWIKHSADMRGYAGQRVRIAFVCEVNRAPFHVLLDNISLLTQAASATRYDIYFGTNSALGPTNLVGTSTNAAWTLPALEPNTTYFWRINTRQGTDTTVGPTWQFKTHPFGFATHFTWAAIANQALNQPFPVALSVRDAGNNLVTNVAFPASVPLQAFRVEDTSYRLLDTQPHSAFVNHDRVTVGYSFTPDTDLIVTAVRRYSGEKISVWNDRGILLASVRTAGVGGAWTVTSLPQPLGLAAGRTYVIGVYNSTPTTNFVRFDALAAFDHGTIHQAFEGNGDAMPTLPHPARWWYVDLVYSPAVGAPLSITPSTTWPFPGGVWRGPVTFHETAPRVYLRAGSNSLSTMFAVTEAPLRIASIQYDGTNATIIFQSADGTTYVVERSNTGLPGTWNAVNSPLAGTGGVLQITDPTAGASPTRFYRLTAE